MEFYSIRRFVFLSLFITFFTFLCVFSACANGLTEKMESISAMVSEEVHSINYYLETETGKNWGEEPIITPDEKKQVTGTASKKYPSIKVRYRAYLGKKDSGTRIKYVNRGGYCVAIVNVTPIIIREARKNKICPLLLKALIMTESGFNNYANGGGALGLCQLMPSTARTLGVKDPFNPEQNIAGGARLLGYFMKSYGSVDKALAAYNLGGGSVSRNGGVPSCARPFIQAVKRNMRW